MNRHTRTLEEGVQLIKDFDSQNGIEPTTLDLLCRAIVFHGILTGKDVKGNYSEHPLVLNTSKVIMTADGEDFEVEELFEGPRGREYNKMTMHSSCMTPGATFQRDECKSQARRIKEGIEEVCKFFQVDVEVECSGSIMNPDRNKFETIITIK